MKVAYLIVEESNHRLVEEGIYTFEEFETLANIVASVTAPVEPSDILVTVYFSGQTDNLDSTIEGVLHLHQRGDWGLMDWLGNAMAKTDDIQIQATLTNIEKTTH